MDGSVGKAWELRGVCGVGCRGRWRQHRVGVVAGGAENADGTGGGPGGMWAGRAGGVRGVPSTSEIWQAAGDSAAPDGENDRSRAAGHRRCAASGGGGHDGCESDNTSTRLARLTALSGTIARGGAAAPSL